MLVIRRRAGESLFLGEDVEVEILEIGASQVKIGIRAPKSVTVLRKEVRETERANLAASRPVPASSLANMLERLRQG
jgi:carbon storage regulator